jgi:hypothetical protein
VNGNNSKVKKNNKAMDITDGS